MNWVIYIWSLTAGICLTLGGIHLALWAWSRDSWANFSFAIGALAAGGYATHDLFQMTVATPAQYAELARWTLVLGTVVTLALVAFIRLYLQAGRLWLLWLIVSLRVLILDLNFEFEPNFYFAEVTELRPLSLLGETIVRPVGEPRGWAFLQQLSHLLIIVFALDAARTAAKGGRVRAGWFIAS